LADNRSRELSSIASPKIEEDGISELATARCWNLHYLDLYPPINRALFFQDESALLSGEPRKIQITDGRRLITAELNGECRFGN